MSDPIYLPTPPAVPATAARRGPTGVVAAAIALGFVSLAMLLLAVVMALGAVALGHSPQAQVAPNPAMPGAVPPSQAVLVAFAVVMALALLSAAVWGGATVAGLLKLKPWARVSIMVMGGALAVLGIFGLFGALSAPLLLKTVALPPGVSAAQLKIVFAAVAAVWGITALVGAWWIIYFALKSTGAAFVSAPPASRLRPPSLPRAPLPPGPLTDFTIAQPLPPAPALPPEEPEDPEW